MSVAMKQQCVLKFLAPEVMASAIIGKGGAVIKQMRESAKAKISLTDHNNIYPGTDCRILTTQANTEEALNEVCNQIIAKISECVQNSTSEQLGQPNEMKLKTLMPRAAVGGIIGKGGATIKRLSETSGAKISVSEPIGGSGPGSEQTVTITGPQQALLQVMQEVNRQVQMLNKEDWFQTWAASATVMNSGGGMGLPSGPNYGLPMQMSAVGGGSSGMQMNSPGVDLMLRAAQGLPPYVMEDQRGFALSSMVPNKLVGGLIGRGGNGTKEVQTVTGTKIAIREIPGDPDNSSMNIEGPLANTCAAYMLMMKRYLDAEHQATS